jgi:hypothetical protein
MTLRPPAKTTPGSGSTELADVMAVPVKIDGSSPRAIASG